MKYVQFQVAYGHSDPRTPMIFSMAQLTPVLPLIVAQAAEIQAAVELFRSSQDEIEQHFLAQFRRCVDEGLWLVVQDASEVPFSAWRRVGQTLATMLPQAEHRLRAQFRLFLFLAEGCKLQGIAPPLFCQFALMVDDEGGVSARSTMSPIFQVVGLDGRGGNFRDGPMSTMGAALALENDRANAYSSVKALKQKIWEQEHPGQTSPWAPEFVDEVLCVLREVLLREQAGMRRHRERVEETVGLEEDPQKDAGDQDDESFWIYRPILEWAIGQCPDTDISGIPDIPPLDIEEHTLIWQTQKETCMAATWCGSEVLVKSITMSYIDEVTDGMKKRFWKEACRHFSLRSPQVLMLYGMSDNRMVLEQGICTLEQALIFARAEGKRWTVRQFLIVAREVLRGLAYLALQMVHRDIACRSIVKCGEGSFKIAQFTNAIPIDRDTSMGDEGVVPVRWTAPEGFAGEFTPYSDMWSFAVMMWEAVLYASATPYSEEVQAAPAIMSGAVLRRPRECCAQLFDSVIAPCFARLASDRPTPQQLLVVVEQALSVTWSGTLLNSHIPFPVDDQSYEEHNKLNVPAIAG